METIALLIAIRETSMMWLFFVFILVPRIFHAICLFLCDFTGIPSFLLQLLLQANVLAAGNVTKNTTKPLGDSKSYTVKCTQSFNRASQANTANIEGYYIQYLLQHGDSHVSNFSCIFGILYQHNFFCRQDKDFLLFRLVLFTTFAFNNDTHTTKSTMKVTFNIDH